MKKKPTGFIAICQCKVIIGAVDYDRTDKREARLLEEMARRINDEGSRALPITFLRNEAAVRRMK